MARSLAASGQPAKAVVDVFGPGKPDEDLFVEIGNRGWYFVSADWRITTNIHERNALLAAGLGAFFFTSRKSRKGRSNFEWLQLVTKRWQDIRAFPNIRTPPFLCSVPDKGALKLL